MNDDSIALSAPDISLHDRLAVARAMDSGWVAPVGPELDAFENAMAARIGVAHAVAVSSGTAALHLALLTAGVGPGTVVVTSTFTFAATANAIAHCGARPVFIDVDPTTGNLDTTLLDEALTMLEATDEQVSAVLPVDIFGKSMDYDALFAVTEPRGIPVVTDSAEAVGATYRGRPVGSFGRASAFSFNGNKIMTTSGGGMLLTDDDGVARRARRLATQSRLPVAHYEHDQVGYNYRLSNVLAALGRSQLRHLDAMIERRRAIRDRYRALLSDAAGISILGGDDDTEDNCWLTSIVVEPGAPVTAAALSEALACAGIESRRLWKPLHLQSAFAGATALLNGVAERLFATGLSLPSGSGMSPDDLERICSTISTTLDRTKEGSDVLA